MKNKLWVGRQNVLVFVSSVFEHPSDSLNSWLTTASPFDKSSNFGNELGLSYPQEILVVASDNS